MARRIHDSPIVRAADLANTKEDEQPRENIATARLMHLDIEAQLHGVVGALRTSTHTRSDREASGVVTKHPKGLFSTQAACK